MQLFAPVNERGTESVKAGCHKRSYSKDFLSEQKSKAMRAVKEDAAAEDTRHWHRPGDQKNQNCLIGNKVRAR